jgi:hypothetical protein
MKGTNESNCQFKFVNKFAKAELVTNTNPKQLVLNTITEVMSHQEKVVEEYASTLPIRGRRTATLTGTAGPTDLATRRVSFLEGQILQARAELAKVNHQNEAMQQQLQAHQTKIDQLSLALNECIDSELSHSNPRLREICLPLLSPKPQPIAEVPVPMEAPITVELDDHGKPIYLQSWNPDVITIVKSAGNPSGRVEKFAPETFAQEAAQADAQAALGAEPPEIIQPSETFVPEPAAHLGLRVDLPILPR